MFRPSVVLSIIVLAVCFRFEFYAFENTTTSPEVPPVAFQGVLDFSHINFTTSTPLTLTGEWDFWWEHFVDPVLFNNAVQAPQPDRFAFIRGSWTGTLLHNTKLPSHGYATYHLKIKVPPETKNLGIRIKSISTAVHLYANGKLVAQAGTPGTDRKSSIPAFAPQVARIPDPVDGTIDLVMHISNFHYKKGGPWSLAYIGSFDRLLMAKHRENGYTILFLGSFLMMAIFHGILFLMRRKEWPSLFMALFCFALVLRIITTNDYIILDSFPFLSFTWVIRIEYFSMLLAASSVANMYQRLFPREILRKRILFLNRFLYMLMVVILLTRPALFTYTTDIFFLIAIPIILYSAHGLGMAIIRKRKGSAISFASLIIISLSYINDYLYATGIIKTGYVSDFTLLLFVLCQAGVLAARLTNAFSDVESLSMDLEILNSQLESQVKERTEELEHALDEIKCISVHDALTGCHNRHYMDERFPVEIERALRYTRPLSVIMCDIDHFKSVNDTWGHQKGDRIIAFIGKACLSLLRDKIDIAIRYGGEEFLIILPETIPEAAKTVAERLRVFIQNNSKLDSDVGLSITMSFGVTGITAEQAGKTVKEFQNTPIDTLIASLMHTLIKDADANMYQAKKEGRNKVIGP